MGVSVFVRHIDSAANIHLGYFNPGDLETVVASIAKWGFATDDEPGPTCTVASARFIADGSVAVFEIVVEPQEDTDAERPAAQLGRPTARPDHSRPFARLLSDSRQQLGITQDELALRLGVTQPGVSAWETGRAFPTLATLSALRKEMGWPANLLVAAMDREAAWEAGS